MVVKIRLSRLGKNKVPYYHIVSSDVKSPRDSNFLEQLGTYDPLAKSNDKKVSLNKERVIYWLNNGAIPTTRVAILLIQNNIKEAEKFKPIYTPKQKGENKKKGDKKEIKK